MAEARRIIDIDDVPTLLRLVEEAESAGGSILLRRGGTDVARVDPVRTTKKRGRRVITEADEAASRAAAGGWRGLVDVERFHVDLEESRRLSVSRHTPFER
jgi:hypothetical protein